MVGATGFILRDLSLLPAALTHFREVQPKQGPPAETGAENRDAFLKAWEQTEATPDHCKAVSTLNPQTRTAGAAWLQEIVNSAEQLWTKI